MVTHVLGVLSVGMWPDRYNTFLVASVSGEFFAKALAMYSYGFRETRGVKSQNQSLRVL